MCGFEDVRVNSSHNRGMDNRFRFDGEERFTPEEESRILELAARLKQRRTGLATVEDLERAAEEAGIEAHYVHEALRAIRLTPAKPTSGLSLPARLLCIAFLAVQGYSISSTILETWPVRFWGNLGFLLVACGLAATLGVLFSGNRRHWLIGLGLTMGSSVTFSLVLGFYFRMTMGSIGSEWPRWLLMLVLMEAVSFALGVGLGKLSARTSPHATPRMFPNA